MGQLRHSHGSKHVGGGNGFIWPPFVKETLIHSLNPTAIHQLAATSNSWRCSGLWGSFGDVVPVSWSWWDLMMRMGAWWLLFTPAWTVVVAHTQSCRCAVSVSRWRRHPWYEVLTAGSMHLWQIFLLWSQKAWVFSISWQSHWFHMSLTMAWIHKPYPCVRRRYFQVTTGGMSTLLAWWHECRGPDGCWHGGHYQ